jgi:histidinol-phosphate/aromatic aminotransferase/cobyric acid decarboxylase-like protein
VHQNTPSTASKREQRITDFKQELKQVREAVVAEKKRLEDELAEEKRKAMEATVQFNTVSIGRSNLRVDDLVQEGIFVVC